MRHLGNLQEQIAQEALLPGASKSAKDHVDVQEVAHCMLTSYYRGQMELCAPPSSVSVTVLLTQPPAQSRTKLTV
jgi:hypothetical protein